MQERASKRGVRGGLERHGWLFAWAVPLALPLVDGVAFRWVELITSLSSMAIWLIPAFILIVLLFILGTILIGDVRQTLLLAGALAFLNAEWVAPAIFWQPLYDAGLWVGLMPFQAHNKEQINFGSTGLFGHALLFDDHAANGDQVVSAAERQPKKSDPSRIRDCDINLVSLGGNYYACTYNALTRAMGESVWYMNPALP